MRTSVTGAVAAVRGFATEDCVLRYSDAACRGAPARRVSRTDDERAVQIAAGSLMYDSVEMRDVRVLVHSNVATLAGKYAQSGTRNAIRYSE
jgi:hypothetical protein